LQAWQRLLSAVDQRIHKLGEVTMASGNVTSFEQIEDGVKQGYADAASLYKGNLDAMIASSQAMIHGVQSVNAEMLAFAQSRMKDALDTSKKLADCQSAEGAWQIQVDFTRAAMQAYAEEFKKISDLTGKVVSDSFSPLAKRGEQVQKTAKAAA
jgi:hypothetical protein